MIKTPKQVRKEKELLKLDTEKRYLDRNAEAMSFCNKHGLTIYPASQAVKSTTVKLFVQKGAIYKPLNNIVYDQNEPQEVKNYVADIDREYERLYLKMKNKV
tara:strand:+ start:1264 stop:1569 length:306 start_codon:yes stop_codon:yes gene_type:complete